MTRAQSKNVLVLDTPVGPHSHPREIHAWLDQLAMLRAAHSRNAELVREIEREEARVVGWLHGHEELSGRSG